MASNARLEQELLVLRQKLQQSRDSKNFQAGLSNNHDSGNGQTAVLETGKKIFKRVKRINF